MSLLNETLDHAAMCEAWTICTVDDVPDEQFADQPAGLTNHPAWVLGHLTFAFDNLARELGAAPGRDESWYAPFMGGSTPTNDRSAYPSKSELIDAFKDSCATLRRTVEQAGESKLNAPVADEMIRTFFPTYGRWAAHALTAEGAFHTGQLSAWRRAKNMPSVFDQESNLQRMLEAKR